MIDEYLSRFALWAIEFVLAFNVRLDPDFGLLIPADAYAPMHITNLGSNYFSLYAKMLNCFTGTRVTRPAYSAKTQAHEAIKRCVGKHCQETLIRSNY